MTWFFLNVRDYSIIKILQNASDIFLRSFVIPIWKTKSIECERKVYLEVLLNCKPAQFWVMTHSLHSMPCLLIHIVKIQSCVAHM